MKHAFKNQSIIEVLYDNKLLYIDLMMFENYFHFNSKNVETCCKCSKRNLICRITHVICKIKNYLF